MLQIAVLFEKGLLDQVPTKTITRAVLTYDEAPGVICLLMSGSEERPCWSDGEGAAEHKPDGCVVARVPTVDWPNNPPPGLIPYSTHSGGPAVKRLGAREWDVTEPLSWQ